MQAILSRVQAHMPFRELFDRYLRLVLEKRINPEISFDHAALERFKPDDYRCVGDRLREAGLRVTFHAPFMDLRPGAIDPGIRQASLDRIRQAFDLVPYFGPKSIVCHPSFDDRYYVSTADSWLQNSMETWSYFIRMAEDMDTTIALENVYERGPRLLKRLLDACGSPRLRFCFDTGHFNVFSGSSLDEWVDVMAPYIFHLHLHDNGGKADEHLAIGNGTFPFTRLFARLREKGIAPLLTLEAHSEETLWRSIENIQAMALI